MKQSKFIKITAVFCVCLLVCVFVSACGNEAGDTSTSTAVQSTLSAEKTEVYTEIIPETMVVTDSSGSTSVSVVGTSVLQKTRAVNDEKATKSTNVSMKITDSVNDYTNAKTDSQPTQKQTVKSTASPKTTVADTTIYTGKISFSGEKVTRTGIGISEVNGKTFITKGGTFLLSGSYNGQLIVSAPKADKVVLMLNGVSIHNENGPALFCDSSSTTVLTSVKNTENSLSDGSSHALTDNNACIYADDDITFNGEGKITVNGNYKNGIYSKNDVKITSGTVTIKAATNGIKCKDKCFIKGGTLNVIAGNDGIKVTESLDKTKGFIEMSAGNVTINAGKEGDGMQAEFGITVSGGKLKVTAGKKDFNCKTKKINENCIVK